MKILKKGILASFIALQLVSCSKDDSNNGPVKVIKDDILKGNVTTILGTSSKAAKNIQQGASAPDTSKELVFPSDVAIDQNGNLYVADGNDRRVKKINIANGSNSIETIAGNLSNIDLDGIGTAASFNNPTALVFSKDYKTLYVTTWRKVRAINMDTKEVTTIAGSGDWGDKDGVGANAEFAHPVDVVINNKGTMLYVSEHIGIGSTATKRIRKIDIASKEVSTMLWNNLPTTFSPQHMIIDKNDENLYLASTWNILKMNLNTNNVEIIAGPSSKQQGTMNGFNSNVLFDNAYSLAFSPNGTYLYIGQGNGSGKRAIRVYNTDTKEVNTLTGVKPDGLAFGFVDGDANTAQFNDIFGMAYDKGANKLYVVDRNNRAIRVVE